MVNRCVFAVDGYPCDYNPIACGSGKFKEVCKKEKEIMPNKPGHKKRQWRPDRVAFGRRKDNTAFYNSRRWRKVSIAFRDANPFCADCDRKGKVSAAAVADHKRGLQYLLDNGLDPYQEEELEGLCHPCHNSKSGRQAHGYKGK